MFNTAFFDDPITLVWGALSGLAFGFLLQRGALLRYSTIHGQFALKDFTVLRVMLTAIVVGGIGVYGLQSAGLIDSLHIKAAHLGLNAVGGVIFGVGMALLGYCPGTGVAVLGVRPRDAAPGVLGMLAGAALYAEVHPWAQGQLAEVGSFGKATLATWWGISPWWFFVGLGAVLVILALAPLPGGSDVHRNRRADGPKGKASHSHAT